MRTALLLCVAIGIAIGAGGRRAASQDADAALRDRARAALRKAVEFYRTRVATDGGYHFAYAEDLSYGRSEMSDGPTRVEIQRDGTPLVAMAYLDAYAAVGDSYYLDAARDVARALVKGQYCSGGWDYYIEFDPAKRAQFPYRADGGCARRTAMSPDRPTTLDDNVTQAAVRVLMRIDRELGFKDASIHEAARYALDSLVKAQYPNGAWPQRYTRFPAASDFPVKRAGYPPSWERKWPGATYYSHYTFNDNSIVDAMDAMLEAARIYGEPRYLGAAEKAGGFILLAQMPEPQPGWAQQYDRDMHPAWARQFEPPSITGGESQSALRALLLLYRETGKQKYLEPIPRALAYYQRSMLPPATNPTEIRRRACPAGTPCVARFYELHSNRPLYITKGTRVTAAGQPVVNVDGYELSYSDTSVITHYAVLTSGAGFAAIERELEAIRKAVPASLRRPETLRGLSPWAEAGDASADPADDRTAQASRVRAAIDAMDERGAWVEEGAIGKSNRVVTVLAGSDLVVTLGGRPLTMKENETLEVFAGLEPPRQRIISTRTFARNVGLLSAYLGPPPPSLNRGTSSPGPPYWLARGGPARL
jgi:PelA/Pel-15E family pectate lyase